MTLQKEPHHTKAAKPNLSPLIGRQSASCGSRPRRTPGCTALLSCVTLPRSMAAHTPHLNLVGAKHLEPLARPVKPPSFSLGRGAQGLHAQAPGMMPTKAEAVTARLAAKSQRLGLIHRNRSPSPELALSSSSFFSCGQYSTHGALWQKPQRPQPTVPRTPNSTLHERRFGIPTKQWHTPASPEFVLKPRPSPDEIFAWRRGWQPNDATGKLNLQP